MQTVNVHAAKAHPSRLVDEAAAGEEIIIARAGRPVALAGKPHGPDDFDAPLPGTMLDNFQGR